MLVFWRVSSRFISPCKDPGSVNVDGHSCHVDFLLI